MVLSSDLIIPHFCNRQFSKRVLSDLPVNTNLSDFVFSSKSAESSFIFL